MTQSPENICHALNAVKEYREQNPEEGAEILGVHLEGPFIAKEHVGAQPIEYVQKPLVETFKVYEEASGNNIKIVTLAPELVTSDSDLIEYLHGKGVKVQAGHCVGGNLTGCDGVTHTFNAMKGVVHRGKSTALSALIEDDIYTEVIADGVHVSDEALKLLFKAKPTDKVILISDCLPCTHSEVKEFYFADEKIYFDGNRAASKAGTIAGSTKLLPDIVKILAQKNMFNHEFISNPYRYHNIEPKGTLTWDEEFNIVEVKG